VGRPRDPDGQEKAKDALTIYVATAYLDATVQPNSLVLEPTNVQSRGEAVRNRLYGPIIPAHLDEHIKRYTRASGEFELAFGREPKAGDTLRAEVLRLNALRCR
jgi:hypothetical protein